MRVPEVGARQSGAEVLRQPMKPPSIEVLTLELVLEQSRPDLILLTANTEDRGLGNVAGLDLLASAWRKEVASIADVLAIQVARTAES